MASLPPGDHGYALHGLLDHHNRPEKREHPEDEVAAPPSKKLKASPEEPALYSENVRKKLAATSRTGQACDRCKERKMKCDPDPVACQPCRQKSLRCYTTDRVTGQSRERGQTDRVESEITYLRDQVAAYQQKYGPLQPRDAPYTPYSNTTTSPVAERKASQTVPRRDSTIQSSSTGTVPSSQYVGWPAPEFTEPVHRGPVEGTKVDILEAEMIDIADFDCDMMHDYPINEINRFNVSKNSITNTLTMRQQMDNPGLPTKDQALNDAQTFLSMMNQFMPVVHRPSFIDSVHRLYDHPASVSIPERVQIIVVLAIIALQFAMRNHSQYAEKIEQSHRLFHYALSFYVELYRERSLSSMQAMALILLHFRNLPKPGHTWQYSHTLLIRAIDMEYHRDPDKIELPPEDRNPLAKELRKRVFHSVLSVCITTGCRVGRPAPWQFTHLDVPLPLAIKDSEISVDGIANPRSGQCDFWPAIQLAKLLPLLTELYNHVISVRRPESEYIKTVEALKIKIDAWRADWDSCVAVEKPDPILSVSGLLMDTWTAEFLLNLHHPNVCTSKSPEVIEKNLDACHKAAKRLLGAFHVLSGRYKGADFTWQSTVAYALGFGATLHVYRKRITLMTQEQFDNMKNELNGWLSLMAYADLVLRTGNHLQRIFQPLTLALEESYKQNAARNSTLSHGSFSHVNGPAAVTPVKAEQSPPQKSYSVIPGPVSTTGQQSSQQRQEFQPSPYSTPPTYLPQASVAPLQYPNPAYSPNLGQYQSLPTSLAPLLNEPVTTGYVDAYQQLNPDDVSMIFSPRHYAGDISSMMWPSMTTGQFSGA